MVQISHDDWLKIKERLNEDHILMGELTLCLQNTLLELHAALSFCEGMFSKEARYEARPIVQYSNRVLEKVAERKGSTP